MDKFGIWIYIQKFKHKKMKIKKLILIIFIAFAFSACKKDYPDDIPQWIKVKIKECKRGNCCFDGAGMEIKEYINTSNQSKIYVFDKYVSMACDEYYDYNGNLLCIYGVANCPSDSCGKIPINNIVFSREIWHEDKDKCK